MKPIEHFKYCPNCGQALPSRIRTNALECSACAFLFFFNPTVAVAALVLNADSHVLFIRRAKEPAKGKLALPGGFVDFDETAEEALRRETREEVNLELAEIHFLCSRTNSYPYHGITYPVLDLFFVAQVVSTNGIAALDAVDSFCWLEPSALDLREIAFSSIREALQYYLSRR